VAPLGALYLKSWLDLCRAEDTLLDFVDEKRLAQDKGVPVWEPVNLDVIFYWIRPATVTKSIECAARAQAAGKKLIAVGPGAYGWWSKFTDQGPFDLIVDGGPYKVVERVLKGEAITGTVTGSPFMPPMRLPEAASSYPIGRLTTTWGALTATTFCILPKMQRFKFRNAASIRAEIKMLIASKDVKYIEVADEALFMHPDCRELIGAFANRKRWAAGLNCESKYGKIARLPEAVNEGLSLLHINALSRNNEVLKSISRRVTRREVDRTFKYALSLRKHGVTVIVRLIYGLPHQTWNTVLEDMDYFGRRDGVYVKLDRLIVQPGTWLWHHSKMSGMVVNDDNEVVSTRYMTEEEIKNLNLTAPIINQQLNSVGPRVVA